MPADFGNLFKLLDFHSLAVLAAMSPSKPIPLGNGFVAARLAADAEAKTDAMAAMVKNWAAGAGIPFVIKNAAMKVRSKKWAGGAGPLNLVFDNSQDPARQLFLVARKILSFPKEHWPHLVNAEGVQFRELHALLNKIDTQGAKTLSVDEMTKLNALSSEVMGPGLVGAPGDVTAPVASVTLCFPPWRKGITLLVKDCLLAYLNPEVKDFVYKGVYEKGTYEKRPDKLAGLACDEIVFAAKSKKNPFTPLEGRWPRGRTAGGKILITFDGVKRPTKKGQKPREV